MIFKKPKGNQNRGRKRKLAAAAILSLDLLFGGPQLDSSNSKTFQSGGNSKTEISRVLEQKSPSMKDFNQKGSVQPEQVLKGTQGAQTALKISSGGSDNTSSPSSQPSKFNAGSKARGAARRDFARRQAGKNSPSRQSGGGFVADAFTVEPKFPARPGGNGLFGRFTPKPTPDLHNPGCAGGPRSVTVLSGQRNSDSSTNYSETVEFNDGYKAQAGNVQLDHILVKHGHQWGIDDIDLKNTRDANNNLFSGKPEQIRTRLTPENREKLRTGIQEMASSSKLESYPNYPISGDMGRAYLCPDTGLFIGIDKDNVIRKAYVASENLINYLRTNCI